MQPGLHEREVLSGPAATRQQGTRDGALVVEVGGAPFHLPRGLERRTADVLQGKYYFGNLPDSPRIRRVVDVGAGIGDFACWAFWRWPNAWIECYEPDERLHPFLENNLPPGAAIHPGAVKGVAGGASLPPCDVLRLDAGGGEADLLRGYRYRPAVVCFDWHHEEDRLEIENALHAWDLRCFKLVFESPARGYEVWLRSKATWSAETQGYVLR